MPHPELGSGSAPRSRANADCQDSMVGMVRLAIHNRIYTCSQAHLNRLAAGMQPVFAAIGPTSRVAASSRPLAIVQAGIGGSPAGAEDCVLPRVCWADRRQIRRLPDVPTQMTMYVASAWADTRGIADRLWLACRRGTRRVGACWDHRDLVGLHARGDVVGPSAPSECERREPASGRGVTARRGERRARLASRVLATMATATATGVAAVATAKVADGL
jgi:hypothetical protein